MIQAIANGSLDQVNSFNEIIGSESQKFEKWLDDLKKAQEEVGAKVSVELERKRFMKREKWDTVIQFHKKKRVMLRHFKSNMPAVAKK